MHNPVITHSKYRPLSLLMAVAIATATGCGGAQYHRYSRWEVQKELEKFEKPGLVIGTFSLAPNGVLDGDTLRVVGLHNTLRLLGIDTEEIWHHKEHERAAKANFYKYLRDMRAHRDRPVKTGTPMGIEAMKWAENFFSDVDKVRLERDSPKEIRGMFNRYLCYVFAKKNGKWVNYNIAAVRAGMAPYFTKYGYSRRFNKQFVEAQKAAQAAHRGIWNPKKKHYIDYPERFKWWNARADFVKKFEEEAKGRDDYIELTNWDAMRRLAQHVGKEVTVLGLVGRIYLGDRGPTRVMLTRHLFSSLPIVFFDKDVFLSSGIGKMRGEFVTVRGFVKNYRSKHWKRDELEIVVDSPTQVTLSNIPYVNVSHPEKVSASQPQKTASHADKTTASHADKTTASHPQKSAVVDHAQ